MALRPKPLIRALDRPHQVLDLESNTLEAPHLKGCRGMAGKALLFVWLHKALLPG